MVFQVSIVYVRKWKEKQFLKSDINIIFCYDLLHQKRSSFKFKNMTNLNFTAKIDNKNILNTQSYLVADCLKNFLIETLIDLYFCKKIHSTNLAENKVNF